MVYYIWPKNRLGYILGRLKNSSGLPDTNFFGSPVVAERKKRRRSNVAKGEKIALEILSE
jgi:hypothetical protein